jgi:S1-C subfamily serine protease
LARSTKEVARWTTRSDTAVPVDEPWPFWPAWSTSPARAQDATPIAKALTLASPGVVSVVVGADVSIQLHRTFRDVVGLRKFTYSTRPMSGGSGMAVAPSTIVTAGHVVDLDEDQKDEARIYAANKLFFDRLELKDAFGDLSATEYYEEQHFADPVVEDLLQGCYNEVYCKFEVKPDVTVVAPVQVGGSKPKELPAKIAAKMSFEEGDTAALELTDDNAASLATVPLATTAGELQPGQLIVASGYPGSATQILKNGRTEPSSSFGHVSNVTTDGNSEVIQVDMRAESGLSGSPAMTEDGKVVGMVSYTGVDDTGNRTQVYLQTADNIRSVLREAGVQPTRGELDTAFAKAMEYYWARHYSAALPLFQKVQDLQEGHLLAKKYLRESQAKAGGPDDIPLVPSSTGATDRPGLLLWALVALGVLIVVALVLLALRWRRHRATSDRAYTSIPADAGGRPHVHPADDIDHHEPALEDDAAMPTPVPGPVGARRVMDGAGLAANSRPDLRSGTVMVQDQESPARGFCPYCGTRLAPEARFCSGCGQAQ